jgi:transcription initiation factor TFIIB
MSLENNLINVEGMTCSCCQGRIVSDVNRGENVCNRCGMVLNEYLDTINAGAGFFSDAKIENFDEPTSFMMYDMELPSFIDKKNIDASGKQIQEYSEIEKLRRLNRFTMSYGSKTRNLNKAVKEIRRITEILGMGPSIAERAGYIYRKAFNKKLIKGRSITGIVIAAIYIACKDAGILFPIAKVENLVENCNKKNVVHYYKLLLRQMKMNVSIPYPSQHVSMISTKARLSGRTERRSLEILSQIQGDPVLSGKKPVSLAAAALYLAAIQIGEHTTQLRIALASELTTITIRKRCLEIDQILKRRTSKPAQ